MSLFRKGRAGYIGLDISDSSLEAVQLIGSPEGKSFKIGGWSRATIEKGAVHDGIILKPDQFAEALRQLLAKPLYGSLDSRSVILSIPEHQCYHVTFRISNANPSTIFNRVQEKVLAKMPFDFKDVYWDWQFIRKQKRLSYFYSVAVQRSVLDAYIAGIKNAGLKVAVAEPQIFSASRFLWEKTPLEEAVVYIDIGAYETAVSTIDDLGIHQSSVTNTGAAIWSEQLAKALKVTPDKAEKVLRTIGMRNIKHDKDEVIRAVLSEGIKQIVKEAKQHMSFYHSLPHIDTVIIKDLIISGGGAAIPNVGEVLSNELKLSLHLSHPWVTFNPVLQPTDLLLLTNSLGAALRGVQTSDAAKSGINILQTSREIETAKKSWWKSK